jgi:CBS domain-containing protein
MLCRDVMKRDVCLITARSTIAEAAALMRDAAVGFLPVCDDEYNVIGVLTDRDIAIRVVAERQSADQLLEEFMTPDVVACSPEEDLRVAQDLMDEMQVSRIVCLDESGRVEGVISLSDIAQFGDGTADTATLRSATIQEARP